MLVRLARWSLALLALALVATALVAQPPGKTKIKEEEDGAPAKLAPQATPTPQAKEPAPLQPLGWGPFSLADEAKAATVPDVKKYLEELALTADEVTTTAGKVYRTAPIPKKFDPKLGKPLTFTTLDGAKLVLQTEQIRDVVHYEERVLEKTRQFLDRRFDAAKPGLSRFLQLRAAEMVLIEALRYHQTLLAQGSRDKATWGKMEDDLKSRLFAVRIDELRALTAERDYATAEELSAKMFKASPGDRVLLEAVEALFVKQCDDQLNQNNFLQARLILEALRDKYLNPWTSPTTKRIVDRLQDEARKLFEVVKQAGEKDRQKALTALEAAEQAWPTLPGLREFRVKLLGEYSVLRIGVRALPAVFSPLTAITDADKMACQLIYEPIVTPRRAPSATDGYVTYLTETPRRIPRGYEFVIPSTLKWSDGTPVKSDDVQRSFEFVSKPGTPRYDPSLDNDGLLVVNQIDETRFSITTRAPSLDPLSFMNFPLLPASRLPRDQSSAAAAAALAGKSLGTGPYVPVLIEKNEIIFKVNPHYQRPYLPGGPAIKEIRFILYTDWGVARQALLDGRWQMLLDGTSKEMDDLTGNPQVIVRTPTDTVAAEGSPANPQLTNPRIYLLGFNYRKPYFQRKEAREAVSLAINREAIIDNIFRGKTKTHHAVLHGPFPLNSWGYDTASFSQSPYASVQAAAKLRAAGNLPELQLAVLAEDLHGIEACKLIQADLKKIGINVNVKPTPASTLAVEMYKPVPEFDLLYTTWDYSSEALNLRPFLDVVCSNGQGANFMGYQLPPNPQDPALMRYFSNSLNNRELDNARRQMYSIHKHVVDNAVFVPLYQLDKHVAVHRNLDQAERLHPVNVFDGVEKWILKAGGQ